MTVLFLDTYYVNGEDSIVNSYLIFKDVIIPIISSFIGIVGAYLILLYQIKKQKIREDEQELSNDSMIRSAYIINLKIVEIKIPELIKILDETIKTTNSLDDNYLHFKVMIDGAEVIMKQDYNSLYKAYYPTFKFNDGIINSFLYSYNAIHSIHQGINNINLIGNSFVEKSKELEIEIEELSNKLVTQIKIVLQDNTVEENLKSFIKEKFENFYHKEMDLNKSNFYFKEFCNSIMTSNQEIHLSDHPKVIEFIIFIKTCLQSLTKLIWLKSDYAQMAQQTISIFKTELLKLSQFIEIYKKYSDKSDKYKISFI